MDQEPNVVGPTYFEVTTAVAMLYFARRKVDLAVLEVGMGGRLDSTNVCRPAVTVITSVSLDHTRELGDTLSQIAKEKAGIIKQGVPVVSGPGEVELLTPTAAAILTTIVDEFTPLPSMKIEVIGYGAGTFESEEFPNVLRLMVGEAAAVSEANADSVCLLETNIDDVSGELVGSVTDELFKCGALDVFTTAIYMKQNRPAVQMSVICGVGDVQKIEHVIFEQGLTFGIRRQILQRSKLAREFVSVETKFGEIRIKAGMLDESIVNAKPEFSECAAAAKKAGVPVKAVLDAAMKAYKKT